MAYHAPLKDMHFALKTAGGIDALAELPVFTETATPDMVEAVLGEAAKLAGQVWAPTNKIGDRVGAKLNGLDVVTPPGFKDAFTQFAEGGWNSLTFPTEYGGQNLPWVLGMAVNEMWQSANLALSLCPLLSQAAIEAIEQYGTDAQKKTYLPKMVSAEWTGTMQLTEPQAGTDLAAIRTVAKKNGDHYLMKGQKIYITWGEHDFTSNIIHLVLARVDGLPEGNDGLGLFIVPKFILNDDGTPGKRNDVKPVSLEHKLGIHGSPTCVMMYGEETGAVAYLVGKEGEGLKAMFTMMNNARIGVGVQGVATCEAAYQHALSYAKDRVQSTKLGDKSGTRVAIIEHPDVRRMLMTMKATAEAARALSYYAGGQVDLSRHASSEEVRKAAFVRADILTPLVKAWCTDLAVENASLGLQIHGGMGFIEETGAAQFYRDARILPIYEGTNGIQSNDLVFRKLLRDGGVGIKGMIADMRHSLATFAGKPSDDLDAVSTHMTHAVDSLERTTAWMLANAKSNTYTMAASAQPYQRQLSLVAGGYMLALQSLAAYDALKQGGGDADYFNTKLATSRFFAEAILPQAWGLETPIMGGHAVAVQIANDQF